MWRNEKMRKGNKKQKLDEAVEKAIENREILKELKGRGRNLYLN